MIFILCQDYPNKNHKYAMSYVHSRNIVYKARDLDITVVSMSAKESYSYEEIKVITKSDFHKLIRAGHLSSSDIVVSHAPNVRSHIPCINKVYSKVKQIIVVFHGHEVLYTSKYYPKPYDFKKTSKFKKAIYNIYDFFKIKILKKLLLKINKVKKLKIIFVSEWMKTQAAFCLNIDVDQFDTYVINNNANMNFLINNYSRESNTLADFITVRPLDESKYSIDLVVEFAKCNPELKFHIYGKGMYFKYNEKPENIEVFNEFISPKDFPLLLNKYKCAIMPTRLDAQGVMVCEIATYGMPVVTSNIEVCQEMLGEFKNVYLVDLNFFHQKVDLNFIEKNIDIKNEQNAKFDIENTVEKEVEILKMT
ncbi:glycosyltransferase [Metasolibacillus meyeri]|uniref:Glycosyltransferase n=1 Tax=Metasolibacillus meyeri TaxID=1071052 RepID=A0AAW9NQZ3_9BACL|nr:glycosyltransferase [Metasolibacillus meyeri]MEC1177744.1 glycosyltransferase [Metasolibacillus meyeri]